MQKLYTFIIAIIVSANVFAQAPTWHYVDPKDNSLGAKYGLRGIYLDDAGNIYCGGKFKNQFFYNVGKWNGNTWHFLEGTNPIFNNDVVDICSDSSGNIYATGGFTNSSNKRYVGKWNGNTWDELGGLNSLAANSYINSICKDNAVTFMPLEILPMIVVNIMLQNMTELLGVN
jgi:hypothetical protein